jgi:hypothetical protein
MKRLATLTVIAILLALFVILVTPFAVYADPGGDWASYRDLSRTEPWGDIWADRFNGTYDIAYFKGAGYTANGDYQVAAYDDQDVQTLLETGLQADGDGNLQAFHTLYEDPTATAGEWHSVVYPDTATPADPYNYQDPDIAGQDTLFVDEAAIPEFPTVIAMVVAVGLSFGIYYWMRKRYHRQAVVA